MTTVYMSHTARLVFPKPEYFITHTQNHTQKNCLRTLSKRELYSSVLATKIDSKKTKAHTMPTFTLFSPLVLLSPCVVTPPLCVSTFHITSSFTSRPLSLSLAPYCCYLTCLPLLPSFFPSINHFVALFFFFFLQRHGKCDEAMSGGAIVCFECCSWSFLQSGFSCCHI